MKRFRASSGRDRRHTSARAAARRLVRLDMIAAFHAIIMEKGMQEEWARKWLDEQVDAATAAKSAPTTTYKVGGVPLSVTGSHVAFMVVPKCSHQDDDDGSS